MAKRELPTAEYVRQILQYDPSSGVFTSNGNRVDKLNKTLGYHRVRVNCNRYYAHRLAWLYVHGVWPSDEIDHIDGDKSNNRISNLRHATKAENRRNIPIRSNNTSGVKGVDFCRRTGKWRAFVSIEGKTRHLGYFSKIEDATAARVRAAISVYGEFARE